MMGSKSQALIWRPDLKAKHAHTHPCVTAALPEARRLFTLPLLMHSCLLLPGSAYGVAGDSGLNGEKLAIESPTGVRALSFAGV